MTSHNVESEFDTLKDDLAKLRADVANLTAAVRDVTSETVQEQMDVIRGRVHHLTDEAKAQGQQRLDELTEQIEERPLTSVLIALGAGFLIGRLFDR